MSPSEKVATRYAEIFVSLFERIAEDRRPSLAVPGRYPQQNIDGQPFRGGNALIASLVATSRGYGLPVWLTMKRKDELGLMVKPGEHSIPVVYYDVYYEDTRTKKRDPAMDDASYAALTDEEKKNWVKRCYMRCYPEFNIQQTNFAEVYPEQYAELVEVFGSPDLNVMDCPAVDMVIGSEDAWMCPVRLEEGRKCFAYMENGDIVFAPFKDTYQDQERYYGDFMYTLARSTGCEGRLERNIGSSSLSDAAQEELICELAGATLSTLCGVQSCIQDRNLSNLKSWVNAIQAEPNIIYKAVNDAAKASDLVSTTLGFEARQGFNVQKVMDGVEAAQQAREQAQQKREQKRAKAAGKGHRKGWNPVKAGKKNKKGLSI